MKIGIITDIHNNLVALKTIVEYFNQQKCDKVICCGDIIGIGPYPDETVQYMMRIPNLIAVSGNHDNYLIKGMPEEYPNEEGMDYGEMLHHKWEHSLLSETSVSFLQKLPNRVEIIIGKYKIAVMHYCMDSGERYVNYTPNPSESELAKMFSDVDSDIIIYGHDHEKMICNYNDKWYINVGSLGCPAKGKNLARAGILTIEETAIEINSIEIVYDAESVVDEITRLNYSEAENIKKYFYGI